MEGKEPTPSENPTHEASSSSTSPHIGDYGGGTQKPEGNDHDVFLSPDIGHFSRDLHNSLVDAEIDTIYFTDHWEKEIGSEILESLMQSKILIPLISPTYAFDKSCLRELVHMLKRKRSSGQIVLPIFYRVTPSQVQRVEGVFKVALSVHEHKGRVDETELGEWRKALAEVGSLRGWELPKYPPGNKGALIKAVVARVVSLLKRTFKLPEELVGLDDHVKYIMTSIDHKYNDTRIIGIYGVHGSGKTTRAKALWNNLSCNFEHLSFVSNIQEKSRRMGIECLQEELICDILRSQHMVSNVDEGIGIMKSQFASKKIFVILDDMDDETHLDALFRYGSWLKAGSIVIITTTNKSILDKANAEPQHKLDELTQDEALTLFNRHLFGKDSPLKAYEDMSHHVIYGIRRIPPILKLIGSSLCQKNVWEKVWQDAIMKLKDEVNNTNVKDVLRMTYNSLYYEQQQIFLDIACFFNGSSKQNPTYMWDSCGFSPKKGIEVLRDMSLIEIDKDDKLIMRDDLRKFGRDIVLLGDEDDKGMQKLSRLCDYEENLDVLANNKDEDEDEDDMLCNYVENLRVLANNKDEDEDDKWMQKLSRLWDYEEALDVLANNKGTNMIQGICLDEYDSERSYTSENFKGLTKLRFLKLCGASFTGDFQNMLSELRWLHWERCPSDFVAANFHPTQLVVLDLSRSEISEEWGGWDPIKVRHKEGIFLMNNHALLKGQLHKFSFLSFGKV